MTAMTGPGGRALMLQGTGSSVGKSLLVAGLCRVARHRGLTVRPFKPQNMSNNAAVTADGGEIGRAQALQARAAGVPPSVHMNPVLLKPQSETGAQIVVQGRVWDTAGARRYQSLKAQLLAPVLDSFHRLRGEADLVLVEGAGSASEVNLRANDIANMGFARAADVPVVVVGDIDRGGVIAALVGTHAVLDSADRALVAGFIVNRMRGDPTLFAEGMAAIARHTGWRPLGLVPHLPAAAALPAEDALDLAERARHPHAGGGRDRGGTVTVVVPLLPRIANFDDLDPLVAEPAVRVAFVPRGRPLPPADLVVLPGSKTTIADLQVLRAEGWDIDLHAHVRQGRPVIGLCGGYQMLGRTLADPDGIEGPPGTVPGLGLLAVDTVLRPTKHLVEVRGTTLADGAPVAGYEMHMGETDGPDRARPFARLDGGAAGSRAEGAMSADGRVCGTYLHGVFGLAAQRAAWLARLGVASEALDHDARVEAALGALAAHLEAHVDVNALLEIAARG